MNTLVHVSGNKIEGEQCIVNGEQAFVLSLDGKNFEYAQTTALALVVGRTKSVGKTLLPTTIVQKLSSGKVLIFARKKYYPQEKVDDEFLKTLDDKTRSLIYKASDEKKETAVAFSTDEQVRDLVLKFGELEEEFPSYELLKSQLSNLSPNERIVYEMLRGGVTIALSLRSKDNCKEQLKPWELDSIVDTAFDLEKLEKPVKITNVVATRVITRNLLLISKKMAPEMFKLYRENLMDENARSWNLRKILVASKTE